MAFTWRDCGIPALRNYRPEASMKKRSIITEEGDPSEYEKKKDLFNIYENELHPKNVEEHEGIKDYTQFDGINDDWEEFNERDSSAKSS